MYHKREQGSYRVPPYNDATRSKLCEGTQKYASLASVCEAPFCARYASSHTRKYVLTPLTNSNCKSSRNGRQSVRYVVLCDAWCNQCMQILLNLPMLVTIEKLLNNTSLDHLDGIFEQFISRQ